MCGWPCPGSLSSVGLRGSKGPEQLEGLERIPDHRERLNHPPVLPGARLSEAVVPGRRKQQFMTRNYTGLSPGFTCRGQRPALWSQFSPSTSWVPAMELKSALTINKCLCSPSLLSRPMIILTDNDPSPPNSAS